ncbi:4'-phosphopantetheinyl transferase superfamily protein [Halomonas sp. ANAO-440]|uniref:4'-phosphopantetheinyl transferase family protein n=1 Tax=Halomonas sp. ANAO-440 TaxID=2861360 RepID=UPI001CAA6AC9|nr:4'-phosphopantetheinyl transferase superfamily protein [Halomonas sp. ANAO-440]MBZ0328872.1 4'-phosphopantetheinyl transferase superfamily protein [Halomonas sp. ANAO-440]
METTPTFHEAFTSVWPWASPLPGVRLVATRFDPTRIGKQGAGRDLSDSGSSYEGIALPPPLQGAIAKRRAEFIAGRLCARRALWLLDGRNATPGMNEDRSPCWPVDCVGAITHNDGWAAALVAPRQAYLGLGLDAERLLDAAQALRLARRVLTPEEVARLERLPESEAGLMVTATFSLKESLFKALYPVVGQMFHFQAAELVSWHGVGAARLRLLNNLGSGWTAGREVVGEACLHEGRLLSLVSLPARVHDSFGT